MQEAVRWLKLRYWNIRYDDVDVVWPEDIVEVESTEFDTIPDTHRMHRPGCLAGWVEDTISETGRGQVREMTRSQAESLDGNVRFCQTDCWGTVKP